MYKPISRNEMRTRANAFAQRWAGDTSERAEAQTFWNEFLNIYGVDRKRVALFEKYAERGTTGKTGRIDLFWPKVLIAEHKSLGKSLDDAEKQALDYLVSIGQEDFPGAVITSDFQTLRVLDLEKPGASPFEIKIADLGTEFERFAYLAGYLRKTFEFELEANVQASELMGEIYDASQNAGFSSHEASVLLPRLLFLMFGDDTGLWPRGTFQEFVETRTQGDGSDFGAMLAELFQVLDTPTSERSTSLDENLATFPYINGGLFSERIRIGAFDSAIRKVIVRATRFDWSKISPAIFGSLFQSVKSKALRRELGEHYTPESTIMKVIEPLFLDELKEQLSGAKGSPQRLRNLRKELSSYRFLDPACGCGNFLIVAYREMRRLELEILRQLRDLKEDNQLSLDPTLGLQVSIDQFAGIEIEEWPAKVAETAMFLVDHQMNVELAEEFGLAPDRLPIKTILSIQVRNALTMDWAEVSRPTDRTVVLGNPPFIGSRLQSEAQKDDLIGVWGDIPNVRTLDYVSGWYAKAASFAGGTLARIAFISTHSISKGEQASIIWRQLTDAGFQLFFAYRTFVWTSDAPDAASVYCVIEGFSQDKSLKRRIYEYHDAEKETVSREVQHINAYLQDAPPVLISRVSQPLSGGAPELKSGNVPRDGGFLSNISAAEAATIRSDDKIAAIYLRRIYGAEEHLQGDERWCLWLEGALPEHIHASATLRDRIAKVRAARSGAAGSKGAAFDRPSLFADIHQPRSRYLLVPSVSAFERQYIPLAFYDPEDIVTNAVFYIEGASFYHFGILQSAPFVHWSRIVSSRLGMGFQLSSTFTYNNYPWPEGTKVGHEAIERAARNVLAIRTKYAPASLAVLYDVLAMPPDLHDAHREMDREVLAAYGLKPGASDAEILSVLFTRYEGLISSPAVKMPRKSATKSTRASW